MPCSSDYLDPNYLEIELSKVACLLDELDGKSWTRAEYAGHHPNIYNSNHLQERADRLVAQLCSRLQNTDVTKYSLEMQIWWRDHQLADKQRIEKAKADQLAKEEKALEEYYKAKAQLAELGIEVPKQQGDN